jgi:acyl-CoA reductase-like NAD-dependent aldehyde dehydrogenase
MEDQHRMLIEGQWVSASNGATFPLVNPYTEEVWAAIPEATSADVEWAVEAARRAFQEPSWSGAMPVKRAELLRRLGDLIVANVDELSEIQVKENGKIWREVRPQTLALQGFCNYFAGLAETVHGRTVPVSVPGNLAYTVLEPMGVVAAIVPWNSPLSLLMWKLCPALATGNTLVVKPSEVTPASALRLAELIDEAGFPPGVVNVITGAGSVGAALAEHPEVDKIAFTGSTAVGQKIARAAAGNLTRVSLELGGKSPNIVFADADMERAVAGVLAGIFGATGQTCLAGSRVLVEKAVYDEFVDLLAARARTIRLGDPMAAETEMGPIACRPQYEKVQAYLDVAEDAGVNVVTGGVKGRSGLPERGFFVPPTIYADVDNTSRIAREEVFGPVACMMPFNDEDHAVALANDTEYGLAAGLWTNHLGRAHRLIPLIRAGTVWVNTYRKTNYAMPFGGFKMSGIGRENGVDAIREYTEAKGVWIDSSGGVADPFNPRA